MNNFRLYDPERNKEIVDHGKLIISDVMLSLTKSKPNKGDVIRYLRKPFSNEKMTSVVK